LMGSMLVNEIGTCHTCLNENCPHPKRKMEVK